MYSKFTASTTVLPGKCVLTAQGRRDAGTLCFLHVEPGHLADQSCFQNTKP